MTSTAHPRNAGQAEAREARSLEQFKAAARKNPGMFTTSLAGAMAKAAYRLTQPGRNPTVFERQFVTSVNWAMERGYGHVGNPRELRPHREAVRPA